MTRLVLDGPQGAQIVREARDAFPRECCGLIEGVSDGDLIRATALHATRNIAGETDRFEIDPVDHVRLLRTARAVGHQIVGCYHSHPNGRRDPSERDRHNAAEDGFVWLIASLSTPHAPVSLHAFMVANGEFQPIALDAGATTG